MINPLTKAIAIAQRGIKIFSSTLGAPSGNGNVPNLDAIAGSMHGRASEYIKIFDEVTAYNNLSSREKPVYNENGGKVLLDDSTLESIAMSLFYEPNKTKGCISMEIGSNTFVYSSNVDYTNPNEPKEWSGPKHLFVVIPRGARLNKCRYENREVVRFIDAGIKDSDQKTFSTLLHGIGYNEDEAEKISKYFIPTIPTDSSALDSVQPTNFSSVARTPATGKDRTRVVAAILAAALIATLAISRCQKQENTKKPIYTNPFKESVAYVGGDTPLYRN